MEVRSAETVPVPSLSDQTVTQTTWTMVYSIGPTVVLVQRYDFRHRLRAFQLGMVPMV